MALIQVPAHGFKSKDGRRAASYAKAVPADGLPQGLRTRRTVYRLIRTVRSRKGFGTRIDTITTFVPSKLKAHKMAINWVRVSK